MHQSLSASAANPANDHVVSALMPENKVGRSESVSIGRAMLSPVRRVPNSGGRWHQEIVKQKRQGVYSRRRNTPPSL